MVHIMEYADSISEFRKKNNYKTILYPAGTYTYAHYKYIPDVFCVCDAFADTNTDFEGMKIIRPQDLCKFDEPLIIIICVRWRNIDKQIKELLQTLDIEAYVFDFCNNIDFNCYRPVIEKKEPKKLEYVHIICHGQKGWIISKFASRLKEALERKNIRVDIGPIPDPAADINHWTEFNMVEPFPFNLDNTDTVMITHITHKDHLDRVKMLTDNGKLGICMSKDTMDTLVSWGVPRENLCYVTPAQDGVIKVKKYVIGITHKNHPDNRKRKTALIDICGEISPEFFTLKIMGSGWEEQVQELEQMGFEVEYHSRFDYEKYTELMQTIDLFLYWGKDEGTMGFLDAVAAGAETLVTPQGFHLDVKNGITYPCDTVRDFIDVLKHKQRIKEERIKSVRNLTWDRYAEKHIKIWKFLLGSISEEEFYENQHLYEDGEFSVFRYRNMWYE